MRRTASPSPLLSRFPTLRRALAGATIVLLIACNSALRDAIRRGDELAAAGEWDKAALAYAEATSIDPDDDEAAEKLVQAKREQAKIRVARGNELLRAGDARGALGPFSDAVRLDPRNMEAKHGLAKAKRAVLDKAQRELEDGHYRASYDLIRAFLLVDPGDPDARRIEAGAKEKIAEAAFNRGTEAEKGGAVALALVDYGETLQFKPDHTDARSRASTLRKALREEVTYYVALKNFDGDPTADSLGSDVDAATLAAGIDAALPLRVVDTTPKPKTYKLQGMRLGGVFRNFDYDKTTTQSKHSCDYICGKELVDNPAYATAEANMRSAQSALGTAEGRLSAAKAAIGPAERARDSAKTSFETKKEEADRAEQDLSRCKSQA
ncbi:MAG: hypothetical protein HOW73_36695, partial [Polyangiaceae bacterium]|nr:hypothetical protein [Polyangiaceae bacterium]